MSLFKYPRGYFQNYYCKLEKGGFGIKIHDTKIAYTSDLIDVLYFKVKVSASPQTKNSHLTVSSERHSHRLKWNFLLEVDDNTFVR